MFGVNLACEEKTRKGERGKVRYWACKVRLIS